MQKKRFETAGTLRVSPSAIGTFSGLPFCIKPNTTCVWTVLTNGNQEVEKFVIELLMFCFSFLGFPFFLGLIRLSSGFYYGIQRFLQGVLFLQNVQSFLSQYLGPLIPKKATNLTCHSCLMFFLFCRYPCNYSLKLQRQVCLARMMPVTIIHFRSLEEIKHNII